jgi:hypothetical protein
LIIPENEKLHITNCYVDSIMCNKKDYDENFETLQTYNIGNDSPTIIFLDDI